MKDDQDIPSLDEVRKAISFQSAEIPEVLTSSQPSAHEDMSASTKAPGDGAGKCVPRVARPVRAKLPPDEESIPVVRARLPPEDVVSLTEEVVPVVRAKLPAGEEDALTVAVEADVSLRQIQAKLPPDEDAIPVVRARLPPEDVEEQLSISPSEEVIPVVRAKLPPGEEPVVDVQQVPRPARAKQPRGVARPVRAKAPPDEDAIPVVRARLPPEDVEEQVSISPTEEVIPVVRAKLPGVQQVPRPIRAKLPPDEDAISVVRAKMSPEGVESEQLSISPSEEVIPVVRAKLPPGEEPVVDVQQVPRPAKAKQPGGVARPVRAKAPPDEDAIPVVRARLPPEEEVSISPSEEVIPVVRTKQPGVQQVPRPIRAKPPPDENSSSPQGKVVRSKLAPPSSSQEDTVPRPKPSSAQLVAGTSGLPKNARNISSQNSSPTPRGSKAPTTQATKRVSPLSSQQSSPSPPPLQQVNHSSSSPPPTDRGEAEKVGPRGKVTRLPGSPSSLSGRTPSARSLPAPSGQRPLVAKGEGSTSSSSPAPSSPSQSGVSRRVLQGAEGVAESPSNLKVPSRPSSRSKMVASPSNQQKRLVSTPTSRYADGSYFKWCVLNLSPFHLDRHRQSSHHPTESMIGPKVATNC